MAIDEEERARRKELHRAQLAAARLARLGRDVRIAPVIPLPDPAGKPPAAPESAPAPDPRTGANEARLARLEGRATVVDRKLAAAALLAAAASALLVHAIVGHRHGDRSHLDVASIAVDRLAVRGSLRIVDESGREIAFLGRESVPGSPELSRTSPVVLGLHATPVDPSESGAQPAVRIAASPAGGAVSIQASQGSTTVQLFASEAGPEIRLVSGDTTQILTESTSADPR
jgi:hypothetical protein